MKPAINNSEFQHVVLCTLAARLFEEICRYTHRQAVNYFMYWKAQINQSWPSGEQKYTV